MKLTRYGIFIFLVCSMLLPVQGNCSTKEDYSTIYKQDLFSPERRQVAGEKPAVSQLPATPKEDIRNRIVLRGIIETDGTRRAFLALEGGGAQKQGGAPSGAKTVLLATGEALETWTVDKVLEKTVELVDNDGQRMQLNLFDSRDESKNAKEKKQAVGLLTKPAPPPPQLPAQQALAQSNVDAAAPAEGESSPPQEAVEQNKASEEERLAEEARREHAAKVRRQRAEETKKRREAMSSPPAPPPVPSTLHQTAPGQQQTVLRTIQIKAQQEQQQTQ